MHVMDVRHLQPQYLPFFFQLVSQLEDFYFDVALRLVFKDLCIGLARAMSCMIEILLVRRNLVAGPQKRAVLLYVAGGATASWGRESNVVGHDV